MNPEVVRRLYDTNLCEMSLYYFFKSAWNILEKTPFVDNWHLQAIAEHLEAVYRREIKNLLINVPPRTGKSLLISIAFPAWVWLKDASEKFLCVSCVNSLAIEHANHSRALIESEWYKSLWCDDKNFKHFKFQLKADQNQKSYFENNRGGYRQSTSVSSRIVGRGGSIIILDDPNDPGDSSEVKRKNVIDFWKLKLSTRSNNPERDARILVQQRTHEGDLTGHIIKEDQESEWIKLVLPMEFENTRICNTIKLPNSIYWVEEAFKDPRKKEGALLFPNRFGVKEVLRLRAELGSYGYAGQCQQRPSPLIGGILQRSWFKLWTGALPKINLVVQSWDTAFSDSPDAAYSAVTTWGTFDNNGIVNIILLSCWRGRVGYPELRDRAKRLYKNYEDITETKLDTPSRHTVNTCIVEAKATGDPLIRDLRLAGVPAIGYLPRGDKQSRVQQISAFIEAGIVHVVDKQNTSAFIDEVIKFPSSESRDYVDTLSQILGYLRDNNILYNPHDPELKVQKNNFEIPYFNG